MHNGIPGLTTMDKLLKTIYTLIEDKSCIYIDEYKWYELHIVLDVLGCDFDIIEDISLLYLMEMNDTAYISEEGVNFVLMNFDNKYRGNVTKILSKDVMPDIKEYSMYMVDHVRAEVKDMGMSFEPDQIDGRPGDIERVRKANGRLMEYALDNKKSKKRRKKINWNEIK